MIKFRNIRSSQDEQSGNHRSGFFVRIRSETLKKISLLTNLFIERNSLKERNNLVRKILEREVERENLTAMREKGGIQTEMEERETLSFFLFSFFFFFSFSFSFFFFFLLHGKQRTYASSSPSSSME